MTVSGHAIIRAEPDEALLWVTLDALKHAPGPALSDVSTRSNALVALLDELGVAKADRSTTGLTVYEDFEHTKAGRRSLGHRAVSRVSVHLADPEVIGRLISQATENLAARIDGPSWQIAPDNSVWLEAAKRAAADGRRKAQAYAEGAGARLGRLIRLIEPDTDFMPARGHIMTAGGPGAEMAAPPMAVERGEHAVTASINATFELEPG